MKSETLAQNAQRWLNPEYLIRQTSIAALKVSTGFSEAAITQAIANAFDVITPASMAHIQRKPSPQTVAILCPASVFTAWLPTAVIALRLGHRIWLKPSVHEAVFAPAWRESLVETDRSAASRVEIIEWTPECRSAADAVIIYGSDETIGSVRSTLQPHQHFVGYGHKLSAAVVFKEAQTSTTLDHLIHDSGLFQLQGCLSPQVVFVQSETWPWTSSEWESLSRKPRIIYFDKREELAVILSKFKPALSCIGIAGDESNWEWIEAQAAAWGASRVCPVGEMQHPPLDWHNGGVDLTSVLG